MKRVVVLIASTLVGCDLTYDVQVDVFDANGPSGFGCTDDAGSIATRLIDQKQGNVTFVIDVLDFGSDLLLCRADSILSHCAASGCPVRGRACYSVHLNTPVTAASAQNALDELHAADAGLANLPTDRNLMVRLMGTTDAPDVACATDRGAFATLVRANVFGCAYSCPIHLSASGTTQVVLDPLGFGQCLQNMQLCSTLETFDGSFD